MLSTEHSLITDYTITESLPGLLESLVGTPSAEENFSSPRELPKKGQEVELVGHRGSAAARFSGSFHRQTDLVFRTVVRATWRLAAAECRARRGGGMFLARQTYYCTYRSIYSSRCLPQPHTPQTLPESPTQSIVEKIYLFRKKQTFNSFIIASK